MDAGPRTGIQHPASSIQISSIQHPASSTMTSIGLRELTWMIEGAIQKIRKEHPFLSQLDSARRAGMEIMAPRCCVL